MTKDNCGEQISKHDIVTFTSGLFLGYEVSSVHDDDTVDLISCITLATIKYVPSTDLYKCSGSEMEHVRIGCTIKRHAKRKRQ